MKETRNYLFGIGGGGIRSTGTILCLMAVLSMAGCATPEVGTQQAPEVNLESVWGVRVEGIRLSAAGHMVDFRYRIIDPDKAALLVDRRVDPILINQENDARLEVPTQAKVGPLRQTEKYGKPREGRVYFVLFGNHQGLVQRGDTVTVVIGDFRAEGFTVE